MRNLQRPAKLFLVTILACGLLPACDKGGDKKDDNKEEEKSDLDKQVEENLRKKQEARDAEAKAAEEKAQAIKDLATLPEEMPKDLTAACEARAAAEDDFMTRNFEGEALTKWEGAKATQLGMVKTNCAKAQNLEVAACQANALNNAPKELAKNLPDLLQACGDKFAEGAAGAAAPPAAE